MKGKKLFKALSFIHPKYIQEAEFDTVSQPRKVGFSHRKLRGGAKWTRPEHLAACGRSL